MVTGRPLVFAVLRVPFFLEPEYTMDESWSESNRERLIRKWGGKAQFEAQKRQHRLKERGQEVGIEHFNLDRKASSTFKSHRLVQWVTKQYGVTKAEALYSELNRRHFEDGEPLNNTEMLLSAAELSGVDRVAAQAFLSTNSGSTEIRAAQQQLRRMGVHSIPTFVIGAQQVVSGAAHSDELVNAFRQIEERGEGAPNSVFGDILGIPQEVLERPLELQ